MKFPSREVLVRVVDATPLKGKIIGTVWDEVLGKDLYLIEFTHGHTARLTEQEVIHMPSNEQGDESD